MASSRMPTDNPGVDDRAPSPRAKSEGGPGVDDRAPSPRSKSEGGASLEIKLEKVPGMAVGISLMNRSAGGGVKIADVSAASPLAPYVSKGDVLVSINGQACEQGHERASDMLRASTGMVDLVFRAKTGSILGTSRRSRIATAFRKGSDAMIFIGGDGQRRDEFGKPSEALEKLISPRDDTSGGVSTNAEVGQSGGGTDVRKLQAEAEAKANKAEAKAIEAKAMRARVGELQAQLTNGTITPEGRKELERYEVQLKELNEALKELNEAADEAALGVQMAAHTVGSTVDAETPAAAVPFAVAPAATAAASAAAASAAPRVREPYGREMSRPPRGASEGAVSSGSTRDEGAVSSGSPRGASEGAGALASPGLPRLAARRIESSPAPSRAPSWAPRVSVTIDATGGLPVLFRATYVHTRIVQDSTIVSNTQTVSWRYSVWRALHQYLHHWFPNEVRPLRFPPKGFHMLGRPGPQSAFVQQRREDLEGYLHVFVSACGAELLHAAITAVHENPLLPPVPVSRAASFTPRSGTHTP